MKKILPIFVGIFIMLSSGRAEANPWLVVIQPPSLPSKGRISPMKEGDKAPFAGTLFDVDAAAQILVEKENAQQKCEIEKNEALERQVAIHNLTLANEKAAKEAAQQRLKEVLVLKNDQIEFLSKQIEKEAAKPKRDWGPVWFASGILGGVILTAVSAYAYGQINR